MENDKLYNTKARVLLGIGKNQEYSYDTEFYSRHTDIAKCFANVKPLDS